MTITRPTRAPFALLTLFALAHLAAGPATKPTTRPAMTDRDSVAYVAKSRPLTFRVPKAWQPSDALRGGGGNVFLFELAGTSTPKSAPRRVGSPRLSMMFYVPCERQAQFDALTQDNRQRMAGLRPDAELVEDRSIEINGEPAWLLQWRYEIAPPRARENDKRKPAAKPMAMIERKILLNRFYAVSELTLSAEAASFDRHVPALEAVAESVKRVEQ